MKTLVCYTDYGALPQFYIIDGDRRHWHGVVINNDMPDNYAYDSATFEKACDEIGECFHDSGPDGPEPISQLSTAIAKLECQLAIGEDYFTAVCAYLP